MNYGASSAALLLAVERVTRHIRELLRPKEINIEVQSLNTD